MIPGVEFAACLIPNSYSCYSWFLPRYQDKLGFRVLSQARRPTRSKFALLEGDGPIIEVIPYRDARLMSAVAPEVKGAFQVHGIFKVGFVVQSLDSVYRELKKRGVAMAYDLMPAKDVPMRSFSVRDVEGNLVQFFGK